MGILGRVRKDIQDIPRDLSPPLHEENVVLKNSVNYLKAELSKFKEMPLLVCDVKRVVNNKVVIRVPNGSCFFVNVAADLKVGIGDTVLVEQRSLTVVQKLESRSGFDADDFVVLNKPNVSWENLGGLSEQIREIREVVELPLIRKDLFKEIGIEPPKGVLLHGPPGTGKTLLAKAVANSANCTFVEVVASELVQKFIGEGAKLVRDIFRIARERAPSILFIDEIDALGAERVDLGTSGEREVHRTFMQLLTEIDGFNSLDDVKILAATNRFDVLDPAILRPGRFDRLIEIPLPNVDARLNILKIHSGRMNLDGVDFDYLLGNTEGFSGADLRSVCTEAGYFAIRENRTKVGYEDFVKAITKVGSSGQDKNEYAGMFG